MKPAIIVDILALELHAGNKRFDSKIVEMIEINKGNARIQYRHTNNVILSKKKIS